MDGDYNASAGDFDERLDVAQELGALRAVDRAMVARERHRHGRNDGQIAVDDGRALLDRADREDRDLRRIEDCDELLDAVHPEVRDGERPALEIGQLELPVACARHDVRAIRGDLLDGLPVGVADDGHDEPTRRRDCEADVCRSEAMELPVDEVRVDRAMADERRRDDAREHVGDGRLRLTLAEQLDHALARCDELGRIRGDGELEDRRLPCLRRDGGRSSCAWR